MGLFATLGRLFRADAAYSTTGSTGRNARWRPATLGPNRALDYSADVLRNQSRELVRKNALAASAIERIVSNTVGTGIKPKIADESIAALWLRWTDESAADGQLDFYGQQQQVMAAVATAGECFIRLRNRLPADGLSVPVQIEILESEFVPMSLNRSAGETGGDIRQGIEFDRVLKSKRVAYWIYPRHPGESAPVVASVDPVRVPASEILHVFLPTRPGQIRGEPWMSRVLDRLADLDAYDKAELVRKKTRSMLVGFIRQLLPTEGLTLEDLTSIYGSDSEIQQDGVGAVTMEPATMQVLKPGEDVTFSDPADSGASYEPFKRSHQRDIAAALGLLYEQLTGDYSQVNDRTWRAAVTEFRRRCEGWQHHLLVFQFCRPVWRRWADMALFSRAAPSTLDPTAPIEWTPQAWPYINPVQDVQAKREEVLAGFTTRAAVVSERGMDVAAIDAENASDQARADDLGLIYATDGRVAANANPTAIDAMPEPITPAQPSASERVFADVTATFGEVVKAVASSAVDRPAPSPASTINFGVTQQATYTEIEAKDDMGRIKSLIVVPTSGVGPKIRRTILHDKNGIFAGHTDEVLSDG